MTALLHIADRVLNRPLLIHPSKAEVILWVLRDRLGAETGDIDFKAMDDLAPGPDASRFVGTHSRTNRPNGLSRQHKGTAIVTVTGSLVNRGAWLGANSGLTSYEGLAAQMRDAANDPEIHSILLDIHSAGGEGAGVFSLTSLIRGIGKTKKVAAFVDDMAYSAAYALASAASDIAVSPTSGLGSIGVALLHLDRSKQLEKAGISPTLIYAGAHKVDANPFGPLPESVREELQKEVSGLYETFVTAVGIGRGYRMSPDAARKTQARTYTGEEAIKLGLADRVASLDQVLSELTHASARRSGRAHNGAMQMENNGAQPGAAQPGISKAEHDKAVADARESGIAAGKADGIKTERDRVTGILAFEDTKGREGVAHTLIKEGASVEMAKAVLASSPKSTSVAARAGAESNPAGLPGAEQPGGKAAVTASWGKAIAKHNARFAA